MPQHNTAALRDDQEIHETSIFCQGADDAEILFGDNPALTTPIYYTEFLKVSGATAIRKRASMIDLARIVESTTAASKDKLPLLNCCVFGDVPTTKGSLKHGLNVLEVHGIEGDYDAGDMPPADAAKMLSKAGISALIYTTPSHQVPGKGNRWRVVVPLSAPCEAGNRGKMVARLDAVLGGYCIAKESFRLAQGFYYGGVKGQRPVETYLIPGGHIDSRDDLDTVADDRTTQWRDGPLQHAVDQSDIPAAVEDAARQLANAIAKVVDAESGQRTDTLYLQSHRIGGLVACGTVDPDQAEAALFDAADVSGYCADYCESEARRHIAKGLSDGAERPTPWTQGFQFNNIEDEDEDEDQDQDEDTDEPQNGKRSRLAFLSPDDCKKTEPRPYVVKHMIGERDVGCIVGAPGVGKSLLAPAIAYDVARGAPAFGRRVKQGTVFYVAAEDAHGMRGRVSALCDAHGSADAFVLVDGVSDLLSEGKVRGKPGPDYSDLCDAVKDRRPSLIVIDTLAMAFPGLEENSAEGMGRVVAVARSLTKWGAAVILVHHDTKEGGGLPRGHSLLNGALDFSIHLKANSGSVVGRFTKNRNGSPCETVAFDIEAAEIGVDIDGDVVTAALARPVDTKPTVDLSKQGQAVLDCFATIAPIGEIVARDEWRAAAVELPTLSDSANPDSRRKAFDRAVRELELSQKVRKVEGGFQSTEIGPGSFDNIEDCAGDT